MTIVKNWHASLHCDIFYLSRWLASIQIDDDDLPRACRDVVKYGCSFEREDYLWLFGYNGLLLIIFHIRIRNQCFYEVFRTNYSFRGELG